MRSNQHQIPGRCFASQQDSIILCGVSRNLKQYYHPVIITINGIRHFISFNNQQSISLENIICHNL